MRNPNLSVLLSVTKRVAVASYYSQSGNGTDANHDARYANIMKQRHSIRSTDTFSSTEDIPV